MKNIIICDEADCPMPATHGLTWTDIEYVYCQLHVNMVVEAGDAMDYSLPRETAHELTDAELDELRQYEEK